MNTRSERHGRTAKQFSRWLKANPNVGLRRQIEAFNSIADSEFKLSNKVKKAKPKPQTKSKV